MQRVGGPFRGRGQSLRQARLLTRGWVKSPARATRCIVTWSLASSVSKVFFITQESKILVSTLKK